MSDPRTPPETDSAGGRALPTSISSPALSSSTDDPGLDVALSGQPDGQTEVPAGGRRWSPAWWVVPALVLLTIAPRVVLAGRLDAVCRDAHFYQMLAGKMRAGDLEGGFHRMGLNLYVGLLAVLGELGEAVGVGAINAALMWGVVAAGLTVVPLFDWVTRQFGPRTAVGAAAAFAVHPTFIEIGVEPIRDGTFWLLIACTLAAAHRAADPSREPGSRPFGTGSFRAQWFLLAGLAATAAVVTRVEGWLLLAPVAGWIALAAWRRPAERSRLACGGIATLAAGPLVLLLVNVTLLQGHPTWEWGRFSVIESVSEWAWEQVAGEPEEEEPAVAAVSRKLAAAKSQIAASESAAAPESSTVAPPDDPLWEVYLDAVLGAFKPALLILCGVGMLAFWRRLKCPDVWPLWAINASLAAAVAQRLIQFEEINGRYFLPAALLSLPTAGLVLAGAAQWATSAAGTVALPRPRSWWRSAGMGAAMAALAVAHIADGLQAAHPRRCAELRAAAALRGRLDRALAAQSKQGETPAAPRVWGLGAAAHLATEVGGDVRTSFDGINIAEARRERPDLIVVPFSSGRYFDFKHTEPLWTAAGFRVVVPPTDPKERPVWQKLVVLVPADADYADLLDAPSRYAVIREEAGAPEPSVRQ